MTTAFRSACAIAVAALIVGFSATAGAATKRIVVRPTALTPFETHQLDIRAGVYSGGAMVLQWAMLKLPVGAKITGLSYRRFATGPQQTNVAVQRVQIGKMPTWQPVYGGLSTVSPTGPTGTTVNGTLVPGATKKVQAGWDYFVLTYTEAGPAIGDITVKYETP